MGALRCIRGPLIVLPCLVIFGVLPEASSSASPDGVLPFDSSISASRGPTSGA